MSYSVLGNGLEGTFPGHQENTRTKCLLPRSGQLGQLWLRNTDLFLLFAAGAVLRRGFLYEHVGRVTTKPWFRSFVALGTTLHGTDAAFRRKMRALTSQGDLTLPRRPERPGFWAPLTAERSSQSCFKVKGGQAEPAKPGKVALGDPPAQPAPLGQRQVRNSWANAGKATL